MLHQLLTANHILESWTFSSAALMNATGTYVTADLGRICYRSDVGKYFRLVTTTPTWAQVTDQNGQNNYSTASQAPAAATRTYLTGSQIAVPPGKLQIGTIFKWKFNMTKTAAGTALSTFDVAVGTAGTTADTARVSFTKPAGTAAVDEAWVEVNVIVRGPLSASGVMVGEFILYHNGNTVGHATIPIVVVNTISGAFDVTVANLFVGLCMTSGAADAITIQMMEAEVVNLA